MTEELKAIARRIRLLALDVDGVLTDGRIHYSGDSEEMKSFSILDGLGIKLVRRCGIQVAIITARRSGAVERRARELGIDHCVQGREDKLEALRELLASTGLTLAETAYKGDGLPDLYATNHLNAAQLWRNLGGGKFADMSAEMFTPEQTGRDKHGAAWADFDNDGRLDLVQLTGAVMGVGAQPMRLLHNLGAIFTAMLASTPRWLRMMVMNGTISMPPPIPNRPARKPAQMPSANNSATSVGSSNSIKAPEARVQPAIRPA